MTSLFICSAFCFYFLAGFLDSLSIYKRISLILAYFNVFVLYIFIFDSFIISLDDKQGDVDLTMFVFIFLENFQVSIFYLLVKNLIFIIKNSCFGLYPAFCLVALVSLPICELPSFNYWDFILLDQPSSLGFLFHKSWIYFLSIWTWESFYLWKTDRHLSCWLHWLCRFI